MSSRAALARSAAIRVLDLIAIALSLPIAHPLYLRIASHLHPGLQRSYGVPVVVALIAWVAASSLLDVYGASAPTTASSERSRVLFSLGLSGLVVGAFGFFVKDQALSRLLIALAFAVAAGLLLAARMTLRLFAQASVGRGRRFAMVGSGPQARSVLAAIRMHPEWRLSLAGFVLPEDGHAMSPRRGPVLGKLSDLGRILEEQVLDLVVFAMPRERLAEIEDAVLLCEEQGVDVHVSLDVLRYGRAQMALADLDGVPVLAFTRKPSDGFALALKRAFDVAVSVGVLAVLSPVLAAIAVAIKLEGKGPVFFRQKRVGVHGRTFSMVKFRSMHVDAEARLEALRAQNEMSGPVFKMTNDPRITRVGNFLRKTSLDELPQFLNVLLGEMSVVGPRPPLPAEVKQYKRWQRRRLSVKPGITCTWQVSGRNDIDFDRWMELDLEYIDTWSLWRDLQICFQTIPAVLSSRGAK